MKRLTVIISEVNNSLHFEWLIIGLKQRTEISCILIGARHTNLESFLVSNNIATELIAYKSKKDFLSTWWKCYTVMKKQRPDIVHTHFWMATLIGISASFVLRVAQRIYTRHHATFHHDYFPKGVYLDRLMSLMATSIVAPTENVKVILTEMENVNPKKVVVINHGINFNSFTSVEDYVVKNLKNKYHLTSEHFPIIGVISRYVELKGIQYIIPAFKKILIEYPNAKLILANAQGDYKPVINQLLRDLPVNTFIEISYETEVAALYKLFDVFVHVPIASNSESFGLIYIEALALGVPSVLTLSGVACDIVKNRENAMVVSHSNAEEIYKSIMEILEQQTLKDLLRTNGPKSVQDFSMEIMIEKLVSLYNSRKSCVAL